MKIELKKVEVIAILVSFESRITKDKINYTNEPVVAHNIYSVLKKMQKYVVPNVRKKEDRLLINALVMINLDHLGMLEWKKE